MFRNKNAHANDKNTAPTTSAPSKPIIVEDRQAKEESTKFSAKKYTLYGSTAICTEKKETPPAKSLMNKLFGFG